ncbi:MAG: hypothetical protein U0T73_10805 [Chitinophagales bacterium]
MKKLLLLICLIPAFTKGQEETHSFDNIKRRQKTINNAIIFSAFYDADFPVGVLRNRYGFISNIGAQLAYRMRANWMIGAEGGFLYSAKTKEDPAAFVSTYEGPHITTNGDLTDIHPSLNGFSIFGFAGKILPFHKDRNPGTGILIKIGLGYLQHKIYYNINPQSLPQFDKNYRTGYDRLTGGAAVSVFAGIIRLERHKYLNLYFGPQFDLGFTQNMRSWDFAEKRKLDEKRVDMMIGIKLGWMVPVFLNKDNEEYYR